MNYKILAISSVIGAGVIGFSLWQTQMAPPPHPVVEHLSSVDIEEPENQFGFMQALSDRAPPPSARRSAVREAPREVSAFALPPDAIPIGLPQIAYLYSYGYRLAGSKIPALQQRHADLCESKGPMVCRIISMDQSGSEGDFSSGTLRLAVASSEARAFGKQLATIAKGSEGEQVSATISGEDLSKQIVDTEARLRARTVLRDRLMEVLATRRGTVTELVEAERGVAQVNEEIDQARSWLSEMKSRVAFSRLDIAYTADQPSTVSDSGGGFMKPVRGALGAIGAILGTITAALILALTVAGPFLLAAFGVNRWRRRRETPAPLAA